MGYILSLLSILSLVSYIFIGVRAFKSSNFTNTQGKVFSAASLVMILTLLSYLALSFTIVTKVEDGLTQSQSSENLEKTISVDHKARFLATTYEYLGLLSYILLATGLVLQYRSGQKDRVFLAPFIIMVSANLLVWSLGSEYYTSN